MAEFQMTERDIKTLQATVQIGESTSPTDIGEITGDSPLIVGRTLRHLAKGGLAEQTDKKNNLWAFSEKGKAYLEELAPQQSVIEDKVIDTVLGKPAIEVIGKVTGEPEPIETIPSQADLFRGIGEKLGVGAKKGEVAISAIIYYVSKTADLDDLNSVWNALTEMGVDNNIKKRWIKIYAQNIPGKKIPEELKEKLEIGQEGEKVTVEGKGEIAPKAKRFSIVAGEMMGDPEGDYTFNEAFKIWAQAKGVPADQVNPWGVALEAMIQTSKEGPAMLTAMLAAITPLITKEPPKSNDNILLQIMQTQQQTSQQQMQALQQMILTTTEDKHKAEIENLKALITTGQKAPGASEEIQALTKRIDDLTQSLHQAQIDSVKEQSQRDKEILQGQIKSLEDRVTQAAQSQRTESSLGLLSKAVDKIDGQLTGVRLEAPKLVETIIKSGGPPPPPRSPEERTRMAQIGKESVEKERRARQLEDELLGQ